MTVLYNPLKDKYLLIDNTAFCQFTQYELALLGKRNIQFLSPEALNELRQGIEDPSIDYYKEDVYALGKTMLYAGNFHLGKPGMIDDEVELKEMRESYSEKLVSCIRYMLRKSDNRPNPVELYKYITSGDIDKCEPSFCSYHSKDGKEHKKTVAHTHNYNDIEKMKYSKEELNKIHQHGKVNA